MKISKTKPTRHTCRISRKKKHNGPKMTPESRVSYVLRTLSYEECLRLYGSKEYADKLYGFSRVVG